MSTLIPHANGLRDKSALWAAALALLCLLPFLPGLSGPFQLDDAPNLARVRLGQLSLGSVYEALFNNPSGWLRRPLSNASLLLQEQLGAEGPLPYKLTNLLLHGFNGWLVWFLARRMLALLAPKGSQQLQRGTALLAAAIWTSHPLQVSSVLYVVQRMTLLSSTFMLLSLLVALRPLTIPMALPRARDGVRHAVLVGVIAFIAVLCKENGALVPALLLAVVLSLPRETLALTTDTSGKRSFSRLAIWLPCILAIALIPMAAQSLTAGYAGRSFSLLERLITETWILGDYLTTMFVPLPARMGLYVDDVTAISTTTPGWYLAPALVITILASALALRHRFPTFAFAVFWFVACHLMESTFIPLELKYEHRNYLALFAPAILVASSVSRLAQLTTKRLGVLVALAIIFVLAAMTLLRSTDWSNENRFIASELRHHPTSVRANMEAARMESRQGRNDLAAKRILAMQVEHPESYAPLANGVELACAGYPMDWDRLHGYIRQRPDDPAIQSQAFYAAMSEHVRQRVCAQGFDAAFNRHIDTAISLYAQNGNMDGLQFFLMIKAQMAADPQTRRQLLLRAVAAAPRETGPLVQLALLDLALGNRAAASETIDQLDHLIPLWHPDRLFVDELRELEAH